jgi:hypothetical protein
MLDPYDLKKVKLNVKLFVIKVAKCKQSSILTSIEILNPYICTNSKKVTKAKDGSANFR